MFRPLKTSFLTSTLCFLLAACQSVPRAVSQAPTAAAMVVTGSAITADKPGQVLSLRVGDTFEVRIPTIPTPGFTWQPLNLDAKVLVQVGNPVYEPDAGSNAAGGTVVLRFKVVGPGKVPLTLIYAMPSGGAGPSLYSQSFGLTVDAR